MNILFKNLKVKLIKYDRYIKNINKTFYFCYLKNRKLSNQKRDILRKIISKNDYHFFK